MEQQEEKLQREIMGDAERKARRLVDRAKRDAEKLLETTRRENEAEREHQLEEARREAGEQARAILASVEHDKRKRWLARRECVIREVCEKALAQLHDGADTAAVQQELVKQALRAIGADHIVVKVPEGQRKLVADEVLPPVLEELFDDADHPGVTVKEDPAVNGGLIALSQDGHRRYDNTFQARLDRLRNSLRCEILDILEPSPESSETT